MKHANYLYPALWGAATVAMSIWLLTIFPMAMPGMVEGFITPIIAFEFITTAEQVQALFGPVGSPERAAWVAAMNEGNRIDFAYMTIYCLFLYTLLKARIREVGGGISPWMLLVVPVIWLGDCLETLQLLNITQNLAGDLRPFLALLMLGTWLKWGCLALVLAVVGRSLFNTIPSSRIVGLLAMLPLLVFILPWLLPGYGHEILVLTVSVAILANIILSFVKLLKH